MYGIPNMKLEKQIIDRKIAIMKKEGVTFVTGTDIGKDIKASKLLHDFDRVVLACGASNPRDINAPGRDARGIYFAVDFLKANTKSLLDSNFEDKKYVETKGKNVVIIGGGDTGNDCVGTSIRLGAKSVTQLEMMPQPPAARTPSNPRLRTREQRTIPGPNGRRSARPITVRKKPLQSTDMIRESMNLRSRNLSRIRTAT